MMNTEVILQDTMNIDERARDDLEARVAQLEANMAHLTSTCERWASEGIKLSKSIQRQMGELRGLLKPAAEAVAEPPAHPEYDENEQLYPGAIRHCSVAHSGPGDYVLTRFGWAKMGSDGKIGSSQ